MRNRLFLVALVLLATQKLSFAQSGIVGGQGYLQGQFVEIGMVQNASFGANPPPASFHPHCDYCAPTYDACPNCGLAEVYDYGHDGWTTGAPAYMGDYTLPGSPFEGWEIQVNGQRNQAFEFGGYAYTCAPCGTLTGVGALTYVHTPGTGVVNWAGTASTGAGLSIYQSTEVDTEGSWCVVTTKFVNTTGTAIPNVYYLRTADPDNDESWPGGAFPTTNTIQYQDDADHRVLVTAYGQLGTFTMWGLGTKDCRAVCFIYNYWPLSGSTDLGTVWSKTYGPADYTVGTEDNGDIAIGLVYNLGNIAPNDSTLISYAYIFGNTAAAYLLDSAFPDPELMVNDSIVANKDTFNQCAYPTITNLPLGVAYGSTRDWTWSHWTWSPGTGLSATTGTSVTVALADLSGPVTYTITGTDTSLGQMMDCGAWQLVVTVMPCASAWASKPCWGDTLYLKCLGNDTLGATYYWYNSAGFISTQRNPYIYPATFADSGWTYVIKTLGSVVDTYKVDVLIHPLPILNLSSTIAMCGPMLDSLNLGATPDSTGETFSWTGPNGFSSTSEFPMVAPFDSLYQGTYFVTGTTEYGCVNSANISVWPGIVPGFTFTRHYGCYFDTVYFTNTSTNANTYSWNFGDGTPTDVNRNTMHVYSSHSLFSVTLECSNAHCDTSITIPVDLRHTVTAAYTPTPDTICNGQTITFNDASGATLNGTAWNLYSSTWSFGDGGSSNVYSPTHTYNTPGVFPVTVTAIDSIGCQDSTTQNVYVIQLALSSFNDTTLCVSSPLPLTNVLNTVPDITLTYTFSWTPGTNLSDSIVQIPTYTGLGLTTYTLTASVNSYGCAVTDTIRIFSVLGKPIANVTSTTTIPYGSSIQLNADSEVLYWWRPDDGTLNNPDINDPIASPSRSTMYTVYGYDANGCLDSAYVDIIVDSTMEDGIPEAFTPNNDGKNDVFKPVGLRYQNLVDFRVYNRWGQQLFYSNNANNGWDGTFNGVPQDIGVYFYSITVAQPGGDGTNTVYKGQITLIR